MRPYEPQRLLASSISTCTRVQTAISYILTIILEKFVINLDDNLSPVDKKLTSLSDYIFTLNNWSSDSYWINSLSFHSLYLFHDLLYCRSVWCVQQFSNKQRFYSSPYNAGQRVGLQTLDQTFTEWSCMEERTKRDKC